MDETDERDRLSAPRGLVSFVPHTSKPPGIEKQFDLSEPLIYRNKYVNQSYTFTSVLVLATGEWVFMGDGVRWSSAELHAHCEKISGTLPTLPKKEGEPYYATD